MNIENGENLFFSRRRLKMAKKKKKNKECIWCGEDISDSGNTKFCCQKHQVAYYYLTGKNKSNISYEIFIQQLGLRRPLHHFIKEGFKNMPPEKLLELLGHSSFQQESEVKKVVEESEDVKDDVLFLIEKARTEERKEVSRKYEFIVHNLQVKINNLKKEKKELSDRLEKMLRDKI